MLSVLWSSCAMGRVQRLRGHLVRPLDVSHWPALSLFGGGSVALQSDKYEDCGERKPAAYVAPRHQWETPVPTPAQARDDRDVEREPGGGAHGQRGLLAEIEQPLSEDGHRHAREQGERAEHDPAHKALHDFDLLLPESWAGFRLGGHLHAAMADQSL